jgi:hypothetical protein
MATVGNLFINVKARTASFSKKMKGVSATVKRMAMGFGKMALKVAKFAAVLGGIAVAAVIAFTLAGIKSVNQLGKTADKLGIMPAKLQALQLAAVATGVTVETFNMAMQRMVRRVSEAGHGFGEAKGALLELGLNAKELSKLPVDEQFKRIADEMEKVATQGDRVRLAMKLFDSEGVALVNTMKGGSAALEAFSKEAEELGLLLSGPQVRAVEVLSTNLDLLKSVWSSLGQHLAVQFAPILTEVTNRVLGFIKQMGGMGPVAEWVVKAFFTMGAGVLDIILAIRIGWAGLREAVLLVATDVVRAMAWAAEKVEESWNFIKGSQQQVISWTDELVSKWSEGMAAGAGAAGLEGLEEQMAAMAEAAAASAKEAAEKAAKIWTSDINNEVSEFLSSMGESLGADALAAGKDLAALQAKGWNLGMVDATFDSLIDKFIGEGFEFKGGTGEIELVSPDFKGAAASLSTAIGNMKVDAGGQERILERQLSVEQKNLKTNQDTLRAIRDGGGALV